MKRGNESAESLEKRRKKKSRWGSNEKEKIFIPGMPTVLPNNLTKEQEEAYLVQLQIEEVSWKLRTGELGIASNPEERSPSPEPIHSSDGKRLNTREYRTRKKLEDERHHLVTRMIELNPEFKPPPDYKPPVVRVSGKVMIPQDEHPDINFVGLLIGPRGNTLKSMERETGAKIIIRGKGFVKEGKVGRKDGQPLPGEDEPLHAHVTASHPEAVKKAVDRIKEIIRQGVEAPEGKNNLRKKQLRELALLNGTLRENDGPCCTNCGATDHKSWMCPDKPSVTNNIVCSACGGVVHIACECRQKRAGSEGGRSTNQDKAKIGEEYMTFLAELGGLADGPRPSREKESNHSNSAALQPRPIMAPPPWSTHAHTNMQPDKVAAPQPTPQAHALPQSAPPSVAPGPPGVMPNLNRPPPPAINRMAVPPPNILQAPPLFAFPFVAPVTRHNKMPVAQNIPPNMPGSYPIHPGVRLKKLPFYELMGELLKPSTLMPQGTTGMQLNTFSFHFTPQQATDIAMSGETHSSKSNFTVQAQMRFCLLETSCEQDDCFPPYILVKVNGKQCSLPNPVPTNRPGVELKGLQRPVNITPLVIFSPTVANRLTVQWVSDYNRQYVIAVYLVKKLTSTELLQKMKSKGVRHSDFTRDLIKEKLNDADVEIATTSLQVSLMCPLGKMRMSTPCRASTCIHLQCFDAALYLLMNERTPTWICPVCDKECLYDNLVIDGYFQDVIQRGKLPSDTHEIQLHPDGSWTTLVTVEKEKKVQPIDKNESVEIIDD